MPYGYPEDWILTLGQRIKRIHVKDVKLATRTEPAPPGRSDGRLCELESSYGCAGQGRLQRIHLPGNRA
jgi:sugar phosphate isomerase/epimerase